MNDIVYAENAAEFYPKESNRCLEIIVPPCKAGEDERAVAGTVKCKGVETEFSKGEILIVPPRTERYIYVKDKDAVRLLIDNAMLPASEITTVWDLPDNNIRLAAEQALYFYKTTFKKRGAVLAALGALILSLATLNAGEFEQPSPVTEKIRADIEKHLSDSAFSLDDYLHNLPLSDGYIRRIFKKDTGLTPHDYLQKARMERAAQILSSGQTNRYSFYTVAQVADLCGYADAMYFSKSFKKHFGVSPTDYCK